MAEKLTWDEIKQRYHEEWIELIDYDWPDETRWPTAGIVRVHARDRKEFYRLAKQGEIPEDGAILFVGPPYPDDEMVRNNLMTITVCGK